MIYRACTALRSCSAQLDLLAITFVLVIIGTATRVAAAPVPILPIDPATQLANSPGPGQYFGFTEGNSDGTVAWTFEVLQPVQVYGIGWYDDGADGLNNVHAVGLSAAILAPSPNYVNNLISATIPSGTLASLIGSYRVVLTKAATLTPGFYAISGWDFKSNPDLLKFAGASVPTDPRIAPLPTPSYGGFGGANISLLAPGSYLGPMLFVQPVPEPSTATLVILGLGFAGLLRRRARVPSPRRISTAARRE